MIHRIRHFFKVIIYLLSIRKIGRNIEGDAKEAFEKDIIKLLVKYRLLTQNPNHGLQEVTITCTVDEYPKINLKILAINNDPE